MQELTLYNDEHGKLITNAADFRVHVPELLRRFDYIIDDDNVKDAKADRALLNKFVKTLADQRQAYEKKTFAAWKEAKEDIMAAEKEIKAHAKKMGDEINSLDDKRKEQRTAENKAFWRSLEPGIPYEAISDPSWLNKSESTKSIHEQMKALSEDFRRRWMLIEWNLKDAKVNGAEIEFLKARFNRNPRGDYGEEIEFLKNQQKINELKYKAIEEKLEEELELEDELPDIEIDEEGEVKAWHTVEVKCTEEDWKKITEYLESWERR